MTIGIAAICMHPMTGHPGVILTASDRMISGSEVEYVPENMTKIMHLGQSVIGLVAGEYSANSEIVRRATEELGTRGLTRVIDVVDVYAEKVREVRNRQAAHTHLAPLGLDYSSFVQTAKSLGERFVDDLSARLSNFNLGVEAIIAGKDAGGPHLFHIDADGKYTCHSDIGFAYIGTGGWHAASHLMLAGYSNQCPLHKALLMIYTAKRRAEVAPGVSADTDMNAVVDTWFRIESEILDQLEVIFNEQEKEIGAAKNKANLKSGEFVGELLQRSIAPPKDREVEKPSC